jgi:superfamily I DNA and/or RNA helicase
MTTSKAADATRGIEFLFSLNRLNVATSRAQARVLVVANPGLRTAKGYEATWNASPTAPSSAVTSSSVRSENNFSRFALLSV